MSIGTTAGDVYLQACLDAAQAYVDRETGRTFEAATATARSFDAERDVEGRMLWLGAELCSTAACTNGDGTAIDASDFVYEPRNGTPRYAITLKASSGVQWTYEDDPENAITVVGKWAYSESAPADIVQACLLIAAQQYKLQDNPGDADRVISVDGVVIVPSSVPRFAQGVIARYRKVEFS